MSSGRRRQAVLSKRHPLPLWQEALKPARFSVTSRCFRQVNKSAAPTSKRQIQRREMERSPVAAPLVEQFKRFQFHLCSEPAEEHQQSELSDGLSVEAATRSELQNFPEHCGIS